MTYVAKAPPRMTRPHAGYSEKVHDEEFSTPHEYVAGKLRDALVADDRVAQLDIDIRIKGKQITIGGSVGTDERRDAAELITRRMLPGYNVLNELQVVNLTGHAYDDNIAAVRIAAVGDVHFGQDSAGQLRNHIDRIEEDADVFLLAGDLTRHGDPAEAKVLAKDLEYCGVPVVAVLGNHDHHSDFQDEIVRTLNDGGISVLEGTTATIVINDVSIGIAGTKGFGGGFFRACGSEFGERIQRDYIRHSREFADGLRDGLQSLDTDIRIALTHFSPVNDTLRGEPLDMHPWLGTHLLAQAMDDAGCDFAFHGHAHAGTEIGTTPGGVPVRNVSQPVIRHAYKVYAINARKMQEAPLTV